MRAPSRSPDRRTRRERPREPVQMKRPGERAAGRALGPVPALLSVSAAIGPRARIGGLSSGRMRREGRAGGGRTREVGPARAREVGPARARELGPARVAGRRAGRAREAGRVHAAARRAERASAAECLAARAPAGACHAGRAQVRALASETAVPEPAPDAVPRSAVAPWPAAASRGDRRTRVACPLRARRSASAAGRRSACPSSRQPPRARPPRPVSLPALRATRGAGRRCRSRRRYARPPSGPTTRPFPRSGPHPPRRPAPVRPPSPLCRSRGAVRMRTDLLRSGTE